MMEEEIIDRIETCPWRERQLGGPYTCSRYFGTAIPCDGRCSYVVDYPKIKKLEERVKKGE